MLEYEPAPPKLFVGMMNMTRKKSMTKYVRICA